MVNNQGSQAWHDQRIGKFTSSQIFRLVTEPKTVKAKENNELSETAKKYVLEKLTEIITGQPYTNFTNEATAWGHEHEGVARELYCEQTGDEILEVGFVVHPDIPNFGGSPDGMFKNFAKGIEIKCPFNPVRYMEYMQIDSDEYMKENEKEAYGQCQSNMLINGCDEWDFVAYCPYFQNKLFVHTVKADPDYQNRIIRKLEAANDYLIEMTNTLKLTA